MQRNGDKDLPPIPLSHNTSSDRLHSPRPRSHDAEATSSGKARQDEKEGQKLPGDKSATPDMIIDSEPVHIQATSQTRQHFSHDRAMADTEKTFESEYLPQRMVQPQSVLVVQAQTPTKDHSHSTAKHQSTKPALRHILDSEESACMEFIEEPPMTFLAIVCRDDQKAGGEEYLGQFNGTKSQQYLTAEFNISNRNKAFLRLCLDPLVVDTNRTFSFKSTSRIFLIITLDNLISKRSMALKKANEDEMPEYISEQLYFKQSAIGSAEVPNARFLSVSLKDYLTILMPRKPGRLANDDELEYILRFRELSVTKCSRLWFLDDQVLRRAVFLMYNIVCSNGDINLPEFPATHCTFLGHSVTGWPRFWVPKLVTEQKQGENHPLSSLLNAKDSTKVKSSANQYRNGGNSTRVNHEAAHAEIITSSHPQHPKSNTKHEEVKMTPDTQHSEHEDERSKKNSRRTKSLKPG